jgi:hypothetical protein
MDCGISENPQPKIPDSRGRKHLPQVDRGRWERRLGGKVTGHGISEPADFFYDFIKKAFANEKR